MNEADLCPDDVGPPPPPADLAERRAEDFRFFIACGAKGNMSMYHLLRDRALDQWAKVKT